MKPVIPSRATLASRSALCLLLTVITACTSPYWVRPEALSAWVADYSVKPDHKALYLFLDLDSQYTGIAGYSWSQQSTAQAETLAKENCQRELAAKGGSGECYPYAIDNQLTGWVVSAYLYNPGNQTPTSTLENLQSLLSAGNALQAVRQNQPAAYEHYMQDFTAVQQRKQMEANQQAGNAQTAALEQQMTTQQNQAALGQSTQSAPSRPSGPAAAGAPIPSGNGASSSQCESALETNFHQWCSLPPPGSVCASARSEETCFEHAVGVMQSVCPEILTEQYAQQAQAAKATADKVCN